MRAPPSTALGHRRRDIGQDSRLRFGTSFNNIVDVFEHLFRALHDALQKIKLHILRLLDAFQNGFQLLGIRIAGGNLVIVHGTA